MVYASTEACALYADLLPLQSKAKPPRLTANKQTNTQTVHYHVRFGYSDGKGVQPQSVQTTFTSLDE
ncbi:unnamed protein product, partial [Brenthis ino]